MSITIQMVGYTNVGSDEKTSKSFSNIPDTATNAMLVAFGTAYQAVTDYAILKAYKSKKDELNLPDNQQLNVQQQVQQMRGNR